MKLNYKSDFNDYIQAGLFVAWKHPMTYFLGIIVVRILVPGFIVLTHGYNLAIYFMFFRDHTIINILLSFIGVLPLWLIAILLQRKMMIKNLERRFLNLLRSKPYLIEEKSCNVHPQSLEIEFSSKNKANINIAYILEENNKFYLYQEQNKMVDIIPCNLFNSEEEKELFLKTIHVPIKKAKRNLLFWNLY